MQTITRKLLGGLAVSLALSAPALAQQEPGDLWEITSDMATPGLPLMPGMAMPGQIQIVCMPRNGDVPPGAADDPRCELHDVKRSANRLTWKTQCFGVPPSNGSGEMIFQGRDRFSARIVMNSEGQAMTVKQNGRRIRECDVSAANARLAAQQRATGGTD